MTAFDKTLTIVLSLLSTWPSLLTLSFFNLWLKDQGCPKTLLASFALIGMPHYFKSLLAVGMHHFPKRGPADQAYWARWMIGSLFFCAIFSFFLGLALNAFHYQAILFWGLCLNISTVFFQKALYFYQIYDDNPQNRDEQTTLSRVAYRWGHHLGEFCTLLAVTTVGWLKIYEIYCGIFLLSSLSLWILSHNKHFKNGVQEFSSLSMKSQSFSLKHYQSLAWEHRYFFVAVLSVVSSDTLIGWHLHLYLRQVGVSYSDLAIISKGWGLLIYTLGAAMAYYIPCERQTLCFYTMIATLAHGFSFIPLAFASTRFYTLLGIFFLKNLTLGLKSILFLRFTTHYIGQYAERVEIYLLSSATRSFILFCVSLSAGWVGGSAERLFGLAFLLSLSSFWILNAMQNHWEASKS